MGANDSIKWVDDTEYYEAFYAMCDSFEAKTGLIGRYGDIKFYFKNGGRDAAFTSTMKVCWDSSGCASPEDAEMFADALLVAAKLARSFAYNGYRRTYED